MIENHSFINEMDRLNAIDAVIENKLNHLNLEYDKLMLEHSENISDIEMKVLMESGTQDDLIRLYTIEAEQTVEKGRGILGSIAHAIRKLVKSVRESLFGKTVDESNVPSSGIKVHTDINALQKQVAAEVTAVKSRSGLEKLLSMTAIPVGTFIISKTVLKPTLDNLNTMAKTMDEQVIAQLQEKINSGNLSPKEMEDIKKELAHAKSTIGHIENMAKALLKVGSAEYKEANTERKENIAAAKADKLERKKYSDKENEKRIDSARINKNISSETISKLQDEIKERQEMVHKMSAQLNAMRKKHGGDNIVSRIKNIGDKHDYTRLTNKNRDKLSNKEIDRLQQLEEQYASKDTVFKSKISEAARLIEKLESEIKERQDIVRQAKLSRIDATHAENNAIADKGKHDVSHNAASSATLDTASSFLNSISQESANDPYFDLLVMVESI